MRKNATIPYCIAVLLCILLPFCFSAATKSVTYQPITTAQDAILLDLNSATFTELTELPGIGSTIAQNILTYRIEHGGFSEIEEALEVEGIGPSRFAAIESYITVLPYNP